MELTEILRIAVDEGASDVFVVAGLPLTFKINGHQDRRGAVLMPDDTEAVIRALYQQARRDPEQRLNSPSVDDDFSFSVHDLGRFRANVLRQRGSLAAVLRVIRFGLPDPAALGIPQQVLSFARRRQGLVLVTGPAGSGKSTTLACMIDAINREREGHIITMEDPIEFIHHHNRCIVTQREIGTRLHCVATDDNHDSYAPGDPRCDSFGGWTMLMLEKLTYENVIAALKQGDFYASTGPELQELYIKDNTLHVKCSPVEKIYVVTEGRRCLMELAPAGENGLTQAAFPLRGDEGYIRVDCRDAGGRHAYSNAYFLDVL